MSLEMDTLQTVHGVTEESIALVMGQLSPGDGLTSSRASKEGMACREGGRKKGEAGREGAETEVPVVETGRGWRWEMGGGGGPKEAPGRQYTIQ
jgi:hypothetical protein